MQAPPIGPVVSLTLNRYTWSHARAGMSKMGRDHPHLRGVPGLDFYRLLGSGRGNDLGLGVDLRRWARLAVWSSPAAYQLFEDSLWRRQELALTQESYTLMLRPTRWHGQWGGQTLFAPPPAKPPKTAGHSEACPPEGGRIAVLTRAAIRPARLAAFWRSVPASQAGLPTQPGLLASVGLGEVPLLHQATFSVWRDTASMLAYAYRGAGHRGAMAQAKRDNWFSEELFVRFAVLSGQGSWNGRDPLASEALGPSH
ncbi:hypothetical protein [Deinococcus detaillensis]|nr:hypothetical protein [Deinococcus detaillensis]